MTKINHLHTDSYISETDRDWLDIKHMPEYHKLIKDFKKTS